MGTTEAASGHDATRSATVTHWLRGHWLKLLLGSAAAVAGVIALHGRIPDPAAVLSILTSADPLWLTLALAAHILSQVAFARQQRTLLDGLAVKVSRRMAIAITYCRSAMSMALPAGSAVSAAFAVRQYRRNGASATVAATGMILSGLASIAGLALLYAGAAGLPGLAVLAALAAGVAVARYLRHRLSCPTKTEPTGKNTPDWVVRLRGLLREAGSVRLRHWADALLFSALNWLLDLFCLVAVAYACGVQLTVWQTATMYLAVQVVRQIPITPGGVGLIEASLLAGFLAAGTPETAAAAAVLGYRILSFWLMLPAGLAAYVRLTRASVKSPVPV